MKKFWKWKNRTVLNQETQEPIQERTLFLNGTIAEESWFDDEVTPQVFKEDLMSGSGDITVWINSPGGSVPMMHAIADTIAALPNDVVTIAFGWAASAGQFVLMMGTPGKRLALPHARILLHQGSGGIGGAAADIELQGDDLRAVRDSVLHRIAEATGNPFERIFEDSLRDRWFTAEEAIEYGLIDRVIDSPADLHAQIGGGR